MPLTVSIKLNIYTNIINYDNNYSSLIAEQGKHPNIKITFVEKSEKTSNELVKKTANSYCVVIPININDIYYCVGLTSVIEAMAMAKPIISTRNPYSPIDIEKEGIGFFVNSDKEWEKAIEYLSSHPKEAFSMGQKARRLAESKYNIQTCSNQLKRLFNSPTK